MTIHATPLVLAALLGLATSASVRAQDLNEGLLPFRDLSNARALALGGASRALGGTADTLVGNPASVTLFPIYRIEVGGGWDFGAKDAFGSLMILDGQARPVAGGVAYQLVSLKRGGQRSTGHLTTLALAFEYSPAFHLGASTRYLVMNGAASANAVTADLGVMFRYDTNIHFGFGGHNLIDTSNPELARYFTASGALLFDGLNFSADLNADFNGPSPQLGFAVGGELIWDNSVPLRVGFRRDAFDGANAIAGGIGVHGEEGGVDIAYQHALFGHPGRLIALTLTFNVR